MRDGPGRRALKWVARCFAAFDLRATRAIMRLRGQAPRYRLEGSCEGCGRCCEEPSIQVSRLVWALPTLRWLFLAWQRRVNGFELLRAERQGRFFAFRCTHYDPDTRQCDSYTSRPLMCRDYPRPLLDQPFPEFFPECTYRPVSRCGADLIQGMREAGLSEEAIAEVERKLMLK